MALFINKRDVREIVRDELKPIVAVQLLIAQRLSEIQTKLQTIIMKVSELAAAISTAIDPLRDLPAQLEKVKAEIIVAIQANNPADPEVPQNVTEALAGLAAIGAAVKMGVEKVDELIPDAPTPPA